MSKVPKFPKDVEGAARKAAGMVLKETKQVTLEARAIERGLDAFKAMEKEFAAEVEKNPQHDAVFVLNDIRTVLKLVQSIVEDQLLNPGRDMALIGGTIKQIVIEAEKSTQEAHGNFMKMGEAFVAKRAPSENALKEGIDCLSNAQQKLSNLHEVVQAMTEPTHREKVLAEAFDGPETPRSGSSPSKLPQNSA